MTRVVKLGGRAQQAPELVPALVRAWRSAPGTLVAVHGGGDEVSALQRAMGREPHFIDGRRVTTEEDITLLRMVLSGLVNKRLVAALVAAGAPAVGVSGEDAALLSATAVDVAAMGRVGEPDHVDVRLVRHLLKGSFLPVISPLARDTRSSAGDALNINGDDAAAALAVALGASELLLIADVPGVLDQGKVAPILDAERVTSLIAAGEVTAGMIAKLEASTRALAGGVSQVRIGDLSALGDPAQGTRIVAASTSRAFARALA
jgi:acetylglutamate kinase